MSERRPLGFFIEQCRKNFTQTGALVPSSRALAHAVTSHVAPGDAPRRILEVGAGTGVFTEEIIRRMGPFDHLDVYEINAAFGEHLERRFQSEPIFQMARGRLTLHRRDVLELPRDAMYDFIVSSLPLNNFEPSKVRAFLDTFMTHLIPGGVLTYFEYVLVRAVKRCLAGASERERLRLVGEVTGEFVSRFQMSSETILLNLPPARARHLVKPVSHAIPAQRSARGLQPAAATQ